jgi:hypothetical protein
MLHIETEACLGDSHINFSYEYPLTKKVPKPLGMRLKHFTTAFRTADLREVIEFQYDLNEMLDTKTIRGVDMRGTVTKLMRACVLALDTTGQLKKFGQNYLYPPKTMLNEGSSGEEKSSLTVGLMRNVYLYSDSFLLLKALGYTQIAKGGPDNKGYIAWHDIEISHVTSMGKLYDAAPVQWQTDTASMIPPDARMPGRAEFGLYRRAEVYKKKFVLDVHEELTVESLAQNLEKASQAFSLSLNLKGHLKFQGLKAAHALKIDCPNIRLSDTVVKLNMKTNVMTMLGGTYAPVLYFFNVDYSFTTDTISFKSNIALPVEYPVTIFCSNFQPNSFVTGENLQTTVGIISNQGGNVQCAETLPFETGEGKIYVTFEFRDKTMTLLKFRRNSRLFLKFVLVSF